MTLPKADTGLLRRMLREPMLHFVVIGIAVFLLYPGGQQAGGVPATGKAVIEITPATMENLSSQFQQVWNRPPATDELQGILREYVREEVLYREAVALGLDRGDAVIRQRLRLKMEFIGEGMAGLLEPTPEELEQYYADNAANFTPPATISFAQILLADAGDAEAALSALTAGTDPATLGRGSLLPAQLDDASITAVSASFGEEFTAAVAAAPVGQWSGPIISTYGPHLVYVAARNDTALPPLDTQRDRVIDAWRSDQGAVLRQAQYDALRERYDVILPDGFTE